MEEKYYKAIIANLNTPKRETKSMPIVLTDKGERYMSEQTEIGLLQKLKEFEIQKELQIQALNFP